MNVRPSNWEWTGLRFGLMATGMLALLGGLWAGLLRLGWAGPLLQRRLPAANGPLVVCGFLGTVISLERAVALKRVWAFLAPGLTRFIGTCLLTGYVWLAVGGGLAAFYGNPGAGFVYDATLHAVFVGFVFSMIFGHAPVIFPSVLGISIPYRAAFYLHVGALHLSLLLRVAGDLGGLPELRTWGGWGNVATILLFLGMTAYSAASGAKTNRAEDQGPSDLVSTKTTLKSVPQGTSSSLSEEIHDLKLETGSQTSPDS